MVMITTAIAIMTISTIRIAQQFTAVLVLINI